MRRSILLLPLLCVAAAALSGCGNKGPLYMPPPKPAPAPANTVPPQPTQTPTTMPPAPAATAAQPASH
ncbi:lipoprotein [Dyella marensis]|uniref:LPS translocon maturation chaperone LptM n=1 Tax=Dyella marensis TaxID=500610 RepID=UPI0031E46291